MTFPIRLAWALSLCVLSGGPAPAQDGSDHVKVVRATGEGADPGKALAAALVAAIRQVNGVEIREDLAETTGFHDAVFRFLRVRVQLLVVAQLRL